MKSYKAVGRNVKQAGLLSIEALLSVAFCVASLLLLVDSAHDVGGASLIIIVLLLGATHRLRTGSWPGD